MRNSICYLMLICLLAGCVERELPDVYNPLEDLDPVSFTFVSVENLTNNTNFTDIRVNFSTNFSELSMAQRATIVTTVINSINDPQISFEFDPDRNFFIHSNVRIGQEYCYNFAYRDNEGNLSESTRICVDVE